MNKITYLALLYSLVYTKYTTVVNQHNLSNFISLSNKGEINMKCCLKIITLIGILAGGILLVDYKTNILMQGNEMGIMDKISMQMHKMIKK